MTISGTQIDERQVREGLSGLRLCFACLSVLFVIDAVGTSVIEGRPCPVAIVSGVMGAFALAILSHTMSDEETVRLQKGLHNLLYRVSSSMPFFGFSNLVSGGLALLDSMRKIDGAVQDEVEARLLLWRFAVNLAIGAAFLLASVLSYELRRMCADAVVFAAPFSPMDPSFRHFDPDEERLVGEMDMLGDLRHALASSWRILLMTRFTALLRRGKAQQVGIEDLPAVQRRSDPTRCAEELWGAFRASGDATAAAAAGPRPPSTRLQALFRRNVAAEHARDSLRDPLLPGAQEEDPTSTSTARTRTCVATAEERRLLHAIIRVYGRRYAWLGLLKLVNDGLNFVGPLILHELVVFLQSKDSKKGPGQGEYRGLTLALGMGGAAIVKALLNTAYTYRCGLMALELRSALCGIVFRKSLQLKLSALQGDFSSGQIQTLMAVDSERVANLVPSAHELWSLPAQILIALGMLYTQVRFSFLAGLTVVLLLIPVNRWLAQRIQTASWQMMGAKDERVTWVVQMLTRIREIKMCGVEHLYARRIRAARASEVAALRVKKYLDALCVYFWAATSLLFSLFTFGAFALAGRPLTPQIAFTSLALFNVLIGPLNSFPWVVNGAMEALVSMARLEHFMRGKEVDPPALPPPRPSDLLLDQTRPRAAHEDAATATSCSSQHDVRYPPSHLLTEEVCTAERAASAGLIADPLLAIEVRAASFTWASEPDHRERANLAPAVRNFSLRVPRAALCVIAGPTGSGKSSILAALAGEMTCIGGTRYVETDQPPNFDEENEYRSAEPASPRSDDSSSMADSLDLPLSRTGVIWVPQTPWLCLGSVRANILFGRGFDPSLYAAVVDACCLVPDISNWKDGDGTWVGDGGANLSVGQRFRVCLARAIYARPSVLLVDDCLSALDAHVAQRVFHEAICGPLLSGTTRILVSHHTQVQKSADLLLYTFDQRPTVSLNADSELIKALPDSVRTLITAPDRVPTELGPANVRGIVAKRSVLAREGSLVGGGGSGDPRLRKHPSRLFLGSSDHYPSELVPLKDGLDEAEDSRVLEGRAAPHAMLDPSLLGGCMDADPSPLKLGPGLSAANRAALFALQRSGSDVGLGSPSGPRKVSLIAPRRAVFEGFSESEVSTPRVSGSSGREDVLSTLSNLSGGGGGRAAAPDRTDLLKRASDTRRIANFIATNAENAQGPRFYESESISEDADLAGPADGPGAHVPAHAHMRLPEEPLEEGRFHGRVPKHVYWVYMLAAGPFLVVVVLISLLLMQASRNGTDLYIAFWSAHAAKSTKPALYFLGWLILLAVANSLLTLIRAFSFANGGINAARTIHDRLLYAVLRAPCAFFDINSRGRVVNRFSSDTSAVDDAAPFIFNIFLANVAAFLGIVAVLCFAQPLMLVVLVPLTFFYLRLQRFYRATSREVRRLDSTSKSPVYAFFAEVIEGLSTIRGLGAADLFILRGDTHLRKYQRAALAGLGISQWLSVRLQLVSAVVITALGTLFVLQREILARHSKKHPPHGVTSSPPLPPYGVLPTTSGRPEYGESEYDGANAARSLLEHGFEWVLQMTMASAFGVEGEDGQRVFVETSPHMAPHVHGVGKSGGAASTWWNYSFTASMLASLVGLSLSYALPLTGLLNGLLTSSAESEQEMVSLERIAEYIETATVMTESHESAATAPGLAASSPPGGTGFLRGRSPDLEGDADLDLDFDYGPAPTGRFGGRENLSSLAHLSQLMAERQGSVALFRAQNILRPAGERKHGARGPGAPPGGLFRPQVGARGPRGPYPRANATGGLTEQDWRVIDYVHRSSVQLRRFLRWAGRAPARWARRLRLGALGGGRSGSLSAMDSLDLDGSDSELMDPEGRNRSEGTPSSCVSIPLTPRLGPSGPMAIGGAGYAPTRRFISARANHIEFCNVWLRYGPEQPWALADLSFRVEGATRAALVGRTGSGKSSALSALLGLYQTQRGVIQIGARLVHATRPSRLRQIVGVVPQVPLILDASLRDNLDPSGRYSEEALAESMRTVGLDFWAHEVVAGESSCHGGTRWFGGAVLPPVPTTPRSQRMHPTPECASFFDADQATMRELHEAHGDRPAASAAGSVDPASPSRSDSAAAAATGLSPAQWSVLFRPPDNPSEEHWTVKHLRELSQGRRQLLCLARVLLQRPSVVVLDEFTAGLDDRAAEALQETVHRSLIGTTVLQVVHKIATMRHVGHVLVMHNGTVAEAGDPEALAGSGGVFASMLHASMGAKQ